MKKIFTLMVALLMGYGATQAQTVKVHKKDGTAVTYSVSEIDSIVFNPAEVVKVDTTVKRTLTGYITATSNFFTDMYYGDSAKMEVLQAGETMLCRFTDATWGTGLFTITMTGGQISGSGKMTMDNHRGGKTTYDATLAGSMRNIAITLPAVMGGTTINWTYGTAPEALKVAAKYKGTNSLMVGSMFGPYKAENSVYTVTANSDGTINITFPEEKYAGTPMGNLTLGTYTISNLAFDAGTKTFSRNYGSDNLKAHLTAEKNGVNTMDKDYDFKSGTVKVNFDAVGNVCVENTYQLGAMPFPITATYTGSKTR